MKWIKDVIASAINPVANVIDNLTTTEEEKLKLKNELAKIQNVLSEKLIDAKRDIMVAELKQEDKYTKRARPTVIYGGLLILFLNYVLAPWIAYFTSGSVNIPHIELPDAFWYAWGGAVSVYAFSRTREKINGTN